MSEMLRRSDGTFSCDFESDGVLIDPTTVTLVIQQPDGTTVTYTYALAQITRVSTGVYRKSLFEFTQVGRYDINWITTGPKIVVYDYFNVPETAFD
jgi:hypothetical protein